VDSEGKPVPKKKRARQLNDQKGNSIADIADVLGRLGAGEKATGKGKRLGLHGEGEGVTVGVRWADVGDARFARGWSDNVVHETLEALTNNRIVGALWGSKKVVEQRKAAAKADGSKGKEKAGMSKEERKAWLQEQRSKNKKKQQKEAYEKKRAEVLEFQRKRRGVYKLRILKQALAQGVSKTEANKLQKSASKPILAEA
jgi:hypothetical protein